MLEEVRGLLEAHYEVVGAVENGADLVIEAQRLAPDLIISDVSMPQMTGFEAVARIRAAGLKAKLIFLTVQSSSAYLKRARALEADGYVLKVFIAEQLRPAVDAVLSGKQYFSPQLSLSGNSGSA